MLAERTPETGKQRVEDAGLDLRTGEDGTLLVEDGAITIDMVGFDSAAQKLGLDFEWKIEKLQVEAKRPPKHIMFIPALLLLGLIWLIQRRRIKATSVQGT